MIVEFVGTSGAGKTTLIRDTQAAFDDCDVKSVPLTGYPGRGPYGQRLSAGRTRLSRAVDVAAQPRLALAAALAWKRGRGRRLLWALRGARLYRRARAIGGVVLVDEGAYKPLTSLLADGVSSSELLVRWLPRPDLCVAVVCDADVAVERLHSRGSPVGEEQARRWHAIHNRAAETLDALVPVDVIDTSEGGDYGEVVADTVVDAVTATLVRPSRTPGRADRLGGRRGRRGHQRAQNGPASVR